jgi:hypothetical protein
MWDKNIGGNVKSTYSFQFYSDNYKNEPRK